MVSTSAGTNPIELAPLPRRAARRAPRKRSRSAGANGGGGNGGSDAKAHLLEERQPAV